MRQSPVLLSAVVAVALGATVLSVGSSSAAEGRSAGDAQRRAAKPYTVTAKVNKTELVLGQKVTITGKVSPVAKGKKVLLQQKIGDKGWKDQQTARVNKRGKYRVTDEPTTLNPRKYRVVKAASKRHRRGVSKPVAVGVYQWHDVYDLSVRRNVAMYKTKTLSIDTVEFPNSIYGYLYNSEDTTGFMDFNLERQCITLRSTFGMSDDADTGSSAKIDVVGDGTSLYSNTFSLLQSQARTIDIHGVFRLAFQFESLAAPSPRPAIASPRVLCSF